MPAIYGFAFFLSTRALCTSVEVAISHCCSMTKWGTTELDELRRCAMVVLSVCLVICVIMAIHIMNE